MPYHRILTIQDISCVGQCSLTVALPILSACGHETAILPSAVLSTHTGGFSGWTFHDLSEDMPSIRKHWEKENILFDALYTGYLGSSKQVDYVLDIAASCLVPGGKLIVDPAMADNGKLYAGFDAPYVEAMKKLCAHADIVLPNATEAALLTDSEYDPEPKDAALISLLQKTFALGAKCVVLTGVSFADGRTGVAVYEGNGRLRTYAHRKISRSYHGTGDVYSSAFTGALVSGKSVYKAASIAADFTVDCIEYTASDDSHTYGVKFEPMLGKLASQFEGLAE